MNWLDFPLAAIQQVGITRLWYAAPIIVSVSLVYSATRHEEMLPILSHAVRFAIWILVFMFTVMAVLVALDWLL